jgi:tetratricopeptide (TPR) repeat protein
VEPTRTAAFDMTFTVDLLKRLSKSGALVYLHPSFGIFFEHFYAEPHGLLYQLQPYATDALLPPPLAPQVVTENETFWAQAAREVLPSILAVTKPQDPRAKPDLRKQLLKWLYLSEEPGGEAHAAGMIYSRALDFWAVELQKTGQLEKAVDRFALALELNPENVVAQTNLEYNKKFRAGQRTSVEMPKTVEDRFGKYSSWDQVLNLNGPYDEPSLCYAQGYMFVQKNLFRQAAQAFERVHAFAPDNLPSRLWLGQLNLVARKPERTMELIRDYGEHPERFTLSAVERTDSLCLLAKTHFQLHEPGPAEALLESAIQATPADSYLLANVVNVYTEQERYSNALVNLDRQLKLNPQDASALLNKGYVYIRINAFDNAIGAMTQLLTLQTNRGDALLNRAIAYLRTDRLDDARKDYEALLRIAPTAHQIYYGLGEIAFRRQDTNTAIKHYQSYLSNSIPGSVETKFIETRLQILKGGKPLKP